MAPSSLKLSIQMNAEMSNSIHMVRTAHYSFLAMTELESQRHNIISQVMNLLRYHPLIISLNI